MQLVELFDIYIMNLAITMAMFFILTFRAWIELKNYRIIWRELEWKKTREVAERILRAEKDMFAGVEGGKELYKLLCELFQTAES